MEVCAIKFPEHYAKEVECFEDTKWMLINGVILFIFVVLLDLLSAFHVIGTLLRAFYLVCYKSTWPVQEKVAFLQRYKCIIFPQSWIHVYPDGRVRFERKNRALHVRDAVRMVQDISQETFIA